MLKYHMDEHVDSAITRALRSRGVDVLTVQDDGMTNTPDELILDRATELEHVVFTMDRDFLREAQTRQVSGVDFAGIVYVHPQGASIGQCVNDQELMAIIYEPAELASCVEYLPIQ
jgi:Domain of unknown function (DUF5615)